jgi:peptide/nickel transport system permease protein
VKNRETMDNTTGAPSEQVAGRKRRPFLVDFSTRLVREKPLATVGGVIVLVLLIFAIFAPWLAPEGFNDVHPYQTLQPPGTEKADLPGKYWMGSDNLGRDVLSRVIYGARISVQVGLYATAISVFISILIGVTTGFIGGRFDLIVQRFVDGWMCFPGIVVLIVGVTIFSPGLWTIVLLLSLGGIGGSRAVRGPVIGIKENVYVQAAIAIGCPTWKVLFKHILPNIMAPVIILFTTRMPGMILAEASISFLGLGIPPPSPSWGAMLSGSGMTYMLRAPWMAVWPGVCLSVVVYGINVFGDGVRDLLDPRLRGGVGRYATASKKIQKIREEKAGESI